MSGGGLAGMTMSGMLRDRCGSTSSAESSCLSSQPSSPPDMGLMEDPRRLRQSNSSRYKTEKCRAFEEYGTCKYGEKCQFAHGMAELRSLCRHPKYKTELCRTFHTEGFCPYGKRCHFVHTPGPKDEMVKIPSPPESLSLGSPMESYSPGEPVFLDNFSPLPHLGSPTRVDFLSKQPEYLMIQPQQDLLNGGITYRDLDYKRWGAQQQQPAPLNVNRRTAQLPSNMSDWQTAQTLRNVLNMSANGRLPVFSGLGTA